MNLFQSFLALIWITATATHASTSQVYWHKMLPNSPMPKAILDLVPSDELGEEKTGVGTSLIPGQNYYYQSDVIVDSGKPNVATLKPGHNYYYQDPATNDFEKQVAVILKPGHNYYYQGAATDNSGKPVAVTLKPGHNYYYQDAATNDFEKPTAVTIKPDHNYYYQNAATDDSGKPSEVTLKPGQNYYYQDAATDDSRKSAAVILKPSHNYYYQNAATDNSRKPVAVTLKPGHNYFYHDAVTYDSEKPVAVTLKPSRNYFFQDADTDDSENPVAVNLKPGHNYYYQDAATEDSRKSGAVTLKSGHNYYYQDAATKDSRKLAAVTLKPSQNYYYQDATTKDSGKLAVVTLKLGHNYYYQNVATDNSRKPFEVTLKPDHNYFYQPSVHETHIHDDPNAELFFLEKDFRSGAKFEVRFAKRATVLPFISRSLANSIPFSSNKLPDILTRFQVEPSSVTAEAIKKTLVECEGPAIEGESKLCVTSLESMVEFSMMSLGTRDVQASSTTVNGMSGDAEVKQSYTVASAGVRAMGGEKVVTCHAQPYPYAVFYCHATDKSKAFKVALEGDDGTKVEAMVMCHLDTSKWNPKHLAFLVLKEKPGSAPVCHFLREGQVVWTTARKVSAV